MNFKYKEQKLFVERARESIMITNRYPDRIPVIVEKKSSPGLSDGSDQSKYLVPHDLTLSQFQWIIRRKERLDATKAMFLMIEKMLPKSGSLMGELYSQYKDKDGFLYLMYTEENTFGRE